jgi:hypothetical protein
VIGKAADRVLRSAQGNFARFVTPVSGARHCPAPGLPHPGHDLRLEYLELFPTFARFLLLDLVADMIHGHDHHC